jgi:hypothetical protein
MKYVRTEKGVYEILAETNTLYYTDFTGTEGVLKSDKVQVADTIEELCDEFVIHNLKTFPKPYIQDSVVIKEIPIELFKKCGMELYGAIWTDKGLIYVAKMNSKGELELI